IQWTRLPFLGGFVEKTMVFNGFDSSVAPSNWPARNLGFGNGFKLISVDAQDVTSRFDLEKILATHKPADEVEVMAVNQSGTTISKRVPLIEFPQADRITYIYFPYIVGLVYLCSGIWIYLFRRQSRDGKAFAILAASAGICLAGLFDLFTTHVFSWLWVIALGMASGSIFSLAFVFPREELVIKRRPVINWVGYAVAFIPAAMACYWLYNPSSPYLFKLAWNIQFGILGAALIFTLCWIGFRRYRLATQLEGRQIRMILIGIGISFLPIAIWLAVSAFSKTKISFVPFLLLPLGVFPILFAYTIQRFRLLSADYILSRVMVYTILAVLVAVGYALVVTGLGMVFSGYFDPFNPLISGLAIFGISLLFLPVRQSMLAAVDQLFFRGNQAYQERLNSLSEAIKDAIDLKTITKIMREHIRDTIAPSQMHVYVFDSMNEQFSAAQDETGKPTSDIRFSSSSALAAALSGSRNPILVNAGVNLSENLKADSTRLRLLGATLIVPLIGSKQLAGWMAFGPRKSGEEYSLKELSFLDKLANQATMAIERAQVLENMEKRVKAMNVLARVAQGVNVTITMDDLFELIYAQTTQILPADDFQISLTNSMSGKLVQEFNVEKDERSTERDGYPLIGAVLEEEVARQRKAIVTTDYVQECQRRGVLSNKAGVYAWVCVPLNTGAETVGVLSMANRNVSEVYTREEVDLLQSIGDQVAGAIVKARLLQESEKRAMQLATLNEVTRQLTSTLDVEPLLNTILQKATDILYCEAGSLLMLDDETGEYVFRATVGPVADDLVNRRLPAGSGLVGKAFTTRQPLIVNNVTEAPDWNAQPDHQTGFITRALLVVPMVVKEKVIGVLEVLNKKDGSPFNTEDQNLLMAFAAQAGVAFDNARLYTTTDQALEARVEELSVMQRIDRELNIGLDSARAMQITLAWAMDQSGATAGLVGPVNEGEVKIASEVFREHFGQSVTADLLLSSKLTYVKKVNRINAYFKIDKNAPKVLSEIASISGKDDDITAKINIKGMIDSTNAKAELVFEEVSFLKLKQVTGAVLSY
ncbi:MAG: GAF domain-containing protein, partial [Anaerolineaceae bacterium]|nr:GAF domain-containing protein [Anaerolineaceae bacterium]